MKVFYPYSEKRIVIDASEMTDGQIGVIQNSPGRSGLHILKVHSGWVLLEDPSTTWSLFNHNTPTAQVRLLPPGSQIILETEK